MKRRVNIQYSIDIDDLNAEVKRLTNTVESKLTSLSRESKFGVEQSILNLSTLEMIEKTRMELANIDFILNDITKIVNAYISFKTQESAPEVEDANENRELKRVENVISDGELFEKIEKIKQMQQQLARSNDSSTQP
tara:strand:- start:87 stop:497 length:411 start_codon:yes stop_codon:yes gene_type:complete